MRATSVSPSTMRSTVALACTGRVVGEPVAEVSAGAEVAGAKVAGEDDGALLLPVAELSSPAQAAPVSSRTAVSAASSPRRTVRPSR